MRHFNVFIIFAFGATFFFNRCTPKAFPSVDPKVNIPTSINNQTSGTTATDASSNANDREYFLAVHRAVNDLKRIISFHKIPEPRITSYERGDNKIDYLFKYIDIIDNELLRLKNQPQPVIQPKVTQKEKQLSSEIEQLKIKLKERDQDVEKLNNELKALTDKLKAIPVITDTLPKKQPYLCSIRLKKSNTIVKEIQVKENYITFNFKVNNEDIFSSHETGSYEIEHYGKKSSCLIIKNPDLFWKKTKELLVWGTDEKNVCVNGDTRIKK